MDPVSSRFSTPRRGAVALPRRAVVAVVLAAGLAAVLPTSIGCGGCTLLADPPPPLHWTPAAPAPLSPGKQDVEVLFTGDLSVARHIATATDEAGKKNPAWALGLIRPTLDSADLVFANLECVLADVDDGKTGKTFAIRADKRYASALKKSGIDVVNLANNHAMDFSHAGFFSTLENTAALGLVTTGVQEQDGQQLRVVEVGRLKMGFLGFNAHGDEWRHPDFRPRAERYDVDDAIEAVIQARPLVDQLVVSIHWGPELSHVPWDWQQEDAHRLVDAGADFIIGHHPHVAQPLEEYKGKLIAYSLGDLMFDKKTTFLRHRTGPRFMLKARFHDKAFAGYSLVPINHDRWFRPYPAPGQSTSTWVRREGEERPTAFRASRAVEGARVRRGDVDCDDWQEGRERLPGAWLRWIPNRWICPDDEERPGDGVGRTAELSGTLMREGVWASPAGEPLAITFPAVPLGGRLEGTVGWPDWTIAGEELVKDKAARVLGPVVFEVKAGNVLLYREELPFAPGWSDFSVDTTAFDGTEQDLEVQIRGPRRREAGFLFELTVPAVGRVGGRAARP